METPASKLSNALARADAAWRTKPLVLMVSGGSDSTALAYLMADVLAAREALVEGIHDGCGSGEGNVRNGENCEGNNSGRGGGGGCDEGCDVGGSGICAACGACDTSADFSTVGILHVNHGLRGAAADADERFVEELAHTLGFPFYCCHVDVAAMARAEGGNEEAIGRRERYAAATEVLADLHAQMSAHAENAQNTQNTPIDELDENTNPWCGYLLTAHTRDDRVENFYMRSIVGTGPGGFRGMARQNGCVLHPLLDCSREELRAYLAARAQQHAGRMPRSAEGALWCEDATNAETDRFRTFVRHEIIPRAKEQNPRLLDTLSRSMDLIADEDDYLDDCACALMRDHVKWANPLGPDWFSQRMGGILPDTQLSVVEEGTTPAPDYSAGCTLAPRFAQEPLVLQRRATFRILQLILGEDARVETASVTAVLDALGRSGAVANIQGNLAVSTNKHGTRIEPMEAFRARRKRL